MEKMILIEMAEEMYKAGDFSELKSGTNCLAGIKKFAFGIADKINNSENEIELYFIGSDCIYMADQIKVIKAVLTKLGYKVVSKVSGTDKVNKRHNDRGRRFYSGASKKRIISFKKK